MKTILYCSCLFMGFALSVLNGQWNSLHKPQISFEFVSTGVKGTIAGFETESRIDLNNLENSFFKGTVATNTLDTNNGLRNWSLRSRKYFNVNDYPSMAFESSEVFWEGELLIVKGNLTIKNTLKPITITFKRNKNQLVGTFSLYASDYGIKIKKKREDNLVKVTLIFTTTP
ncbi:MAG: YceI family protein [Flavobacteriaceae bacterium]